jgi:acetoacetate decarboxylase
MGFVKSSDEIAKIQAVLHDGVYTRGPITWLNFLTTEETVSHLLPPGLQPADEPRATAYFSVFGSNMCGDFDCSAVFLAARHGELQGNYLLAMYVDTDQALTLGRELLGEPKKLGRQTLEINGSGLYGALERNGIVLFEIDVELGEDQTPPADYMDYTFNYKGASLGAERGFQHDAILSVTEDNIHVKRYRTGSGTVQLRGTHHDPLDEIEVVRPLDAGYIEADITSSRYRHLMEIPRADFLPYQMGRNDDWAALDTSTVPQP